MKPDTLYIANWEKLQHYHQKTSPPWIKLYRDMMQEEWWLSVSDASRLLSVVCMMIAAKNDGAFPNNPEYIKRISFLDATPDFSELLSVGFLTDSRATLERLYTHSRESLGRREEKEEKRIESAVRGKVQMGEQWS